MFYLLPPKGFSTLSSIENDVHTRFIFMKKIVELKGDDEKIQSYFRSEPSLCSNFDCLIEGSKRDRVSHFIFRVSCARSGKIQDYWIKGEKELLSFRLKSQENLFDALTTLLIDIRKCLNSLRLIESQRTFLEEIFVLLNTLKDKDSSVFLCKKRKTCSHFINVPWIFVHELVAFRHVSLHKGIAKIPCFCIYDLFVSLFEMIMRNGINQIKYFNVRFDEDDRLVQIRKNIISYFVGFSNPISNSKHKTSLSHRDVEKRFKEFPLCMLQLHLKLKDTGRLTHHERFRYSLFLKDIGMPLNESIRFWKRYYSEAPKCNQNGCQHMWKGSEGKKFEYGLRHLYGEEGKRISYSSHSCSSLQALRPQPQNCGGCPFLHLDNSQLSSLVSKNEKITQIQLEAILRASNDANPSLSCELYLAASTHKHSYKRRQLLRSISYSSVEKRPRSSLMRKTFSSVHPHENSASIKEICLTCSSNVINPDVSFLSPVVYYHLRVLNNNNKPKI